MDRRDCRTGPNRDATGTPSAATGHPGRSSSSQTIRPSYQVEVALLEGACTDEFDAVADEIVASLDVEE